MKQDLECIYKSFSGCGSFYMAVFPIHKLSDHLNRYGIRAILNLSPNRNIQPQYPGQFQLLTLPTDQNQHPSLRKDFQKSFLFFDRNRAKTNILICGNKKSTCLVFLYAFLMKKYKYNLANITKLLGYTSKNVIFEPHMIQQLKKISILYENNAEEQEEGLLDSKIGRRIKRIRNEYTNLANNSRRSSSRSSKGQYQYTYQISEPSTKIDFTPQTAKMDYGLVENQPQLMLKTHSRHVKRLSNFY